MITARVVFGVFGVFDLCFAHRNTRVLNLLIFRPEFTDSARVYEHARTLARSALRAAKHTHRHRAPPLVGPNVYLDFKGMGPTVM